MKHSLKLAGDQPIKITLATRVVRLITIIAAVIAPIFGLVGYRIARATAMNEIIHHQEDSTTVAMSAVERMLGNASRDIQLIAENGSLRERLETSATSHDLSRDLLNQKQFDAMVGLTGPWQHVLIADLTGTIVVSEDRRHIGESILNDSGAREVFLRAGEGLVAHGDACLPKNAKRPALVLGAPIRSEAGVQGRIIGVALGWFDLSTLNGLLDEIQPPRVPRIVNADGMTIATRNGSTSEIFRLRLNPIAPASNVVRTSQVQKGTVGYQSNGWRMVLDVPNESINAPLHAMAGWFLIWAAVLTVSFAAVFFFVARYFARPVEKMTEAAARVSEGDLESRVDIRTGDELERLGHVFNEMVERLKSRDEALLLHQTHLEDTVAQRTGELFVAKDAAEKSAEISAGLARESALILNSATDGILGIGLDGRAKFLNPAGSRMFDMMLSDMEGKTIHDAVHHSHPDGTPWPEADCASTNAIKRGESLALGEDTYWRKDGTSFPVEFSSTPMFDGRGEQQGAVVMFRDVTERRALEHLKSQFVSTVSHELRTPLTSIRGALGLLSSGLIGPIDEKGRRMLEIAVNNTDRLIRLINDILDQERIESGKVELVRRIVDANALMVQTLEGVQSMADQAGVHVVIVPTTAALWGDSDRIIQTLTNLLGNAIKFSPRDTTVTLSGTEGNADFRFCVADQGRGVPADKLKTIFGRFSQVDASDSRDKGGTGLGLSICESIVTAHGGRIWAEQNQPAGTRFLFTIPLVVPDVDTPAIESPAPRTIVVLPDESSPNVTEILERGGFRIVTAASSSEVLALAASGRPDAIVLGAADGDHGGKLVDALKSTPETRDIPIVVVAGQSPETCEQYADKVATWIGTPVRDDSLILALDLAFSTPSVLVVEDDLDLAAVMTAALQNHGILTFHAATGIDAVRLCRQHHPSLIVLDLVLPDIDGFSVVNSLRESATLGRVPLLVYSALDVGILDQSRLRLGPTEFLTKSRCSPADFEARVIRFFQTVTDKPTEGQHAA